MKKYMLMFLLFSVLSTNCSFAKRYDINTWVSPTCSLVNEKKIIFDTANVELNSIEHTEPLHEIVSSVTMLINDTIIQTAHHPTAWSLEELASLYMTQPNNYNMHVKKTKENIEKIFIEARQKGFKYIALYSIDAGFRSVHYQGQSIPYTSYENAYVYGPYGSATIRVPQQKYINTPSYSLNYLDVTIEVRVFDINLPFMGTSNYFDNYVACSRYTRSRKYMGGYIFDVFKEGITAVTKEIFGSK